MKISNDVLEVLSRCTTNGANLLLPEALARPDYVKVNKVIEAAGGKWNRQAKAHVFDQDAETRMEQVILTGEVVIPKDEFDFFPTPPDVVELLMEIACIEEGMMVLEPEAGQGAIAYACLALGADVTCVELMEKNFDTLAFSGDFGTVVNGDFLLETPIPAYDRIVMNPPFTKQADIKHVNHALKCLKPDGILVSVMSAGVEFRSNKLTTDFRAVVNARNGEWRALPEGAFKSSGTMVSTLIVSIPGTGVPSI